MEKKNIIEKITALIDNQLENEKEKENISRLILDNEEYRFESEIQRSVKDLLSSRRRSLKVPEELETEIHALLKFEIGKSRLFIKTFNEFDAMSKEDFCGCLHTDNHNKIKDYFAFSGISYNACIEILDNWALKGAMITEEAGKRLANCFYKDGLGHYMTIYHAPKTYFDKESKLHLPNIVDKKLSSNGYYIDIIEGLSTVIVSRGDILHIIISNDKLDKIQSKFIMK